MLFDCLTLGMVGSVGRKGRSYEGEKRNVSCLREGKQGWTIEFIFRKGGGYRGMELWLL